MVAQAKIFPSLREGIGMAVTFGLTVFAWIFFRAENIGLALSYIYEIFSSSLFTKPEIIPKDTIILIGLFLVIEWFGREQQYAIAKLAIKWPKTVRWAFYYIIVIAIVLFFPADKEQQFIYFQF